MNTQPQIPDLQNKIIALAKLHGWTDIHLYCIDSDIGKQLIGIPRNTEQLGPGIDNTRYCPLEKNYFSDFNALHSLLEKLTGKQWITIEDYFWANDIASPGNTFAKTMRTCLLMPAAELAHAILYSCTDYKEPTK